MPAGNAGQRATATLAYWHSQQRRIYDLPALKAWLSARKVRLSECAGPGPARLTLTRSRHLADWPPLKPLRANNPYIVVSVYLLAMTANFR